MGFDLSIEVHLRFCPEKGIPFYYDKDYNYEYDLLTVPEPLREYVKLRGHFLHAYTEHFNDQGIYEVDVYDFVEKYPKWKDIMEIDLFKKYCDGYWYEKDHDRFLLLLQWCKESRASFFVKWSY